MTRPITHLYFCDQLIRAREESGIKAVDFSRVLKITPTKLSNWELAKELMPDDFKLKVEKELEVTLPIIDTAARYSLVRKVKGILYKARDLHRHTTPDLAHHMDVSENSIYKWSGGSNVAGGNSTKMTSYLREAEIIAEDLGIHISFLYETRLKYTDDGVKFHDAKSLSDKAWGELLAKIKKKMKGANRVHVKSRTDVEDWKNQLEDFMETVADTSTWRAAPIYPHTGNPEPMQVDPSDKRVVKATAPEEKPEPAQHVVQVTHRNNLMVDTTKIVFTVTDDKLKLIADFAQHVNNNFKGTL